MSIEKNKVEKKEEEKSTNELMVDLIAEIRQIKFILEKIEFKS